MFDKHMYNLPHILFLMVFVIITVVQSLLLYKKTPSEKCKKIYTFILSIVIIIGVILTRVSVTVHNTINNIDNYKWYYFVPDTWCSLNGIMYALNILAFKRNKNMLHFTAFLGFLGGVMAIFFPNFLQEIAFFDVRSFPSFLYHACMILLSLFLIQSHDLVPTLSKSYFFVIGMIIYMLIGAFEKNVMHMPYPMQLDQPFFTKTPFLTQLTSWYTVILGQFIFVIITCLIFDLLSKKKKDSKITNTNMQIQAQNEPIKE